MSWTEFYIDGAPIAHAIGTLALAACVVWLLRRVSRLEKQGACYDLDTFGLTFDDSVDSSGEPWLPDPDDQMTWPLHWSWRAPSHFRYEDTTYSWAIVRPMPEFDCATQNSLLRAGVRSSVQVESGTADSQAEAIELIRAYLRNHEEALAERDRTPNLVNAVSSSSTPSLDGYQRGVHVPRRFSP